VGRLTLACFLTAFAIAAPAHAGQIERWHPLIDEASAKFGVSAVWIERVMQAESNGQTEADGRRIASPKGAMGLMQLMPETWAEVRQELRLGPDPYEPRNNILAGTYYLRRMYDRFGYPGLFAAYNAGPSRYADKLARRRALPLETRKYLIAVKGARPLGVATFSKGPLTDPPRASRSELFFSLSNQLDRR
jgi:soluble lytic murein transglycosylase-like protein